MATFALELITAEGRLLSTDADFMVAPGALGELGILPKHIPLLTALKAGELVVRRGNDEDYLFVSGGFLEVLPDKVVVLADAAERAEDIDEARAEAARHRAEAALAQRETSAGAAESSAALERALFRLKIAELRKHRRTPRSPQ